MSNMTEIAEILDAHPIREGYGGPVGIWSVECMNSTCRFVSHGDVGGLRGGAQAHHEHVAAILVKAGFTKAP